MAIAVTSAVAQTLLRRPFRGPAQPTWTWGEELFVAASRAALLASGWDVEMMSPHRRGLRPPIGRQTSRALTVEHVDLDGIRAERYCPRARPSGTILRFHGGGFVTGSARMERRVAAELAVLSNCDTFGISYRLAPQHPYPAALQDAVAAYRAILERGADPATTLLFGGSAGAGLALAALLKIRELQLPQPAGAVLLWPYADFTFSGETIQTNGDIDMLPLRDLAPVWGPAYVGHADPADPLVSPALADLHGLPPLLIIAGGAETLLSCAERIADNARRAGIANQFTVYPHKVHGWMLLPKLPATLEAIGEIRQWIAAILKPQSRST
ncbi:MAG: alpha/beta hydrolase fold domain-containing protein [Acidimicrobiia bacterium]